MTTMTRRGMLAAAATAGAAAAAPGLLSTGEAAAAQTSVIWAVHSNDNLSIGGGSPSYWPYIAALEQKLGRPFAGFRRNGITGSDDLANYRRCYDQGWHWAYANGKQSPSGSLAGFWRDVAAGKYDTFYRNYYRTILSEGAMGRWSPANPFHFSFHHEQYVRSEGGGTQAGTAAEYRAAFQHLRALMSAESAHVTDGGNMLMCWVPHVNQFLMDPVYGSKKATSAVAPFVVSKLDPGSDAYDLVGADIYLRHTASTSAAAQWKPVHDFALDHGKAFFTGETGVAGSDTKVVHYLQQLDALLKAWGGGDQPGQCAAICWTSRVTGTDDDRLDSTKAKLAQYRQMALDPFYGATT